MDNKDIQHNFDRIFDKLDVVTEIKKDVEYIKKEMDEKKADRKKIIAIAVTSGVALFVALLNIFFG